MKKLYLFLFLSALLMLASYKAQGTEPPVKGEAKKKVVKKIEVKVGEKVHVVYVNISEIEKFKDADFALEDSKTVILPAGYDKSNLSAYWYSYLENRSSEQLAEK